MNNTIEAIKPKNIDRIPLAERMPFHVALMKLDGYNRGVEDHEISRIWTEENAGRVSDIIDDADRLDHEKLKKLIMSHDQEKINEAAAYVLKVFQEGNDNLN